MLGTLCSSLLILGVSAAVGQAAFAVCGRRRWTPLCPAVGLAVLLAVAWGTVRLPGEGTSAAIALGLLLAAAALVLRGRLEGFGAAARVEIPIAATALLLAALPFIVEARFGILGTGVNPDMSQHLFAAHRLADGGTERLISEGYPLGPHALAVALSALGPSLVEAFNGLAIAAVAAACLAALPLFVRLGPAWRVAGALLVGFAYLLAASYVQGAFKETLQALFVLAFAVALHETARAWPDARAGPRAARGLPLAALAIGSAYTYSFPGLAWLGGTVAVWAAIAIVPALRDGGVPRALRSARLGVSTAAIGFGVLALAIAPELGRMASFASFETFNPDGGGLGNLFNRLSPLEALGIWPSGDFRVEPGGGEAPAIFFWLGGALALGALGLGLARSLRSGQTAIPAALAAAVALWLFSLLAGTPYQEAKALVMVAPLAALLAIGGLFAGGPRLLALVLVAATAGSSMLVLANGPVGPEEYSPELAELRTELGSGSVLVLAPPGLLADQHGRDYLVWELRGRRVCVEEAGKRDYELADGPYNAIVTIAAGAAVEPQDVEVNPLLALFRTCPLIPDGARADPAADG